MNCPHCGTDKSRILESRGDRRVRQCSNCLKHFSTWEVLAAYAGFHAKYIHEAPPQEAPLETEPLPVRSKRAKPARFHPVQLEDELLEADNELAALLVSWWDESRWSKHQKSASWTRAAWLSNANRVIKMPHAKAMALAKRGVEMGWQSLQEEYVNDVSSADQGQMAPRNSAMQKAIEQIEQWQSS
tara:strand:+ start:80 stop:637 length:558 start_codon:yes stop_codon:yes gene_type:complete